MALLTALMPIAGGLSAFGGIVGLFASWDPTGTTPRRRVELLRGAFSAFVAPLFALTAIVVRRPLTQREAASALWAEFR